MKLAVANRNEPPVIAAFSQPFSDAAEVRVCGYFVLSSRCENVRGQTLGHVPIPFGHVL